MIDFDALAAPWPPQMVKWRIGPRTKDKLKGQPLCYVDARAVMQRLDDVLGPENWQDEYVETTQRIICRLGIKVNGEWVWKSDGAGDTDMEGAKGGLSDAFKRAAVKWGCGRYLYNVKVPWVALDNGYLPKSFNGTQFLPTPSAFSSKQMKTKYYKALKKAAADDDAGGARELWGELDNEQQLEIWSAFGEDSYIRSTLKTLLGESNGKAV